MTVTKKCNKCGKTKSLDEFHKASSRKDGHAHFCKDCVGRYYEEHREEAIANSRKRYEEHSKEVLAIGRKWREAHLDKVRAHNSKYYEEHREKAIADARAYQKAHPEATAAYGRRHREAHPEAEAATSHRYREVHPEEARASSCRYREVHPEVYRRAGRKRRAILAGVAHESYTDAEVYQRDKGICQICGESIGLEPWVLDHFYPINPADPTIPRGPDIWDNVRLAHKRCNSKKGNKLPTHEEAQAWLTKIQSWHQSDSQMEIL